MRIVWLAEKPSLRAASCCSVEVVNGGGGLRVSVLVSTASMVKCPAFTSASVARASASLVIVNRSILSPRQRDSRALNGVPLISNSPAIDQYCSATKASISRSRSTIMRNVKIGRAHVCTPVTNAPLVCRLLLAKKKKQQNIQVSTHSTRQLP